MRRQGVWSGWGVCPGFIVLLAAFSGCSYLRPKPKEATLLENGKNYLARKDYSRAILVFKSAIQINPKDPEAYYQLGVAYLAAGEPQPAASQFMKAADLNPGHAGAQLKLAEMMAANRDPEVIRDAEKRAREVLKVWPGNPDALNARAVALARLDRVPEAIQELERSLAGSPRHLNSASTLATLKAASGDVAGGEQVLRKVAAASPQDPEPELALSRFYWMLGKASPAGEHARRALELAPNHSAALQALASIQVQQGRGEEAAHTYQRLASSGGPEHRTAYATYLLQHGKTAEGIAELERLAARDPKDRMLRTQLVQAYLSSGRLEQAERALTEALRSNRKDSDALIQRAEIYLRRNRLADAGQDLSQALKSQPDSALAHWVMSQLNRVQGHSLNQRQELTNALRLDPHLLGARVELSRNLIASKAASSALDVLEQAPADQKKLPLYLVERNAALLALGDLVRLRKGIDEGLALGRHPDLLLQDGILRIKTRDFNRARRSLEEALRLNPNDLRIPETIALSYVAEQRKPAALAALRQYAAAHPKSAGAHSLVGRWLFQSGDAAAARASFEAAAALDPGHVEAGEALAEMDLKDGKFDAARSRLHTLLASNPQNAQLRLLLASAEEKAGNSQAALAQYRQILSADAHHVIALNNLAYGLAGTQPDEALRLAQQARELAPNSAAVEETLGWALYQKGLYQPAVRYLESAVKRQPTPRGQYHLALAYRKLGNLRQSDESLKAALRLDPSMPEAQAARELLERSTR